MQNTPKQKSLFPSHKLAKPLHVGKSLHSPQSIPVQPQVSPSSPKDAIQTEISDKTTKTLRDEAPSPSTSSPESSLPSLSDNQGLNKTKSPHLSPAFTHSS